MPKQFEVVLTGVAAVTAKLNRLGALGPYALARALNDIAEDVMSEAKDLTPVRNFAGGGTLRRSGSVIHAQPTQAPMARIVFGAVYAEAVHENPRAGKTHGVSPSGRRYKHWAEVGEWHFLETPFVKMSRTFKAEVGRRVQREWSAFL